MLIAVKCCAFNSLRITVLTIKTTKLQGFRILEVVDCYHVKYLNCKKNRLISLITNVFAAVFRDESNMTLAEQVNDANHNINSNNNKLFVASPRQTLGEGGGSTQAI